MTHEEIDIVIERAADEPDPVTVSYIYYVRLEFSTAAMLAMVERDCKEYDKRDRELIPSTWDIEATSDYLNTRTVTFSHEDGVPFDPEEVERVRAGIEAIERTYWLMTRRTKR